MTKHKPDELKIVLITGEQALNRMQRLMDEFNGIGSEIDDLQTQMVEADGRRTKIAAEGIADLVRMMEVPADTDWRIDATYFKSTGVCFLMEKQEVSRPFPFPTIANA